MDLNLFLIQLSFAGAWVAVVMMIVFLLAAFHHRGRAK